MDEVDSLIALDELIGFDLGRQIRSLHSDGYCKFYFAGHLRLREVSLRDFSPFKNLANYIPLVGLQEEASKDLLRIPMKEIGFHFSNEQAQNIFWGTAGIPYLIQEFCIRLLCGLSRNEASKSDIKDRDIEEIAESQDYLNVVYQHCSYGQGPDAQCIMLVTAMSKEVTRQDIVQEFEKWGVSLKRSQLDGLLLWLVEFGILEAVRVNEDQYKFRILPLYLQQAIMAMEPEQLLKDSLQELLQKEE